MKKNSLLLMGLIAVIHVGAARSTQYDQQKTSFHKICCVLLGSKDAPAELQSYFNDAINSFGIADNKKFSVKLINKCPFLNNFSSFTWFGTWINQCEWQKMSDLEKEWAAYHEIAHQKLNHPTKQIVAAVSTLFGSVLFSHCCKLRPVSAFALTGALLGVVSSGYSRMCERQADILAAIVLCDKNKNNVVADHIKLLSSAANEWSMWFNSSADQINYLQKIVD